MNENTDYKRIAMWLGIAIGVLTIAGFIYLGFSLGRFRDYRELEQEIDRELELATNRAIAAEGLVRELERRNAENLKIFGQSIELAEGTGDGLQRLRKTLENIQRTYTDLVNSSSGEYSNNGTDDSTELIK